MKKNTNRTDTILDIMSYMDAPIFKDKFEVFYNDDIDSLVLLAKNIDCMHLLFMYAYFEDSPAPEEIQIIFSVPENRVVFIQGSDIENFANSLIEFLMFLRVFKV